MEEIPEGTEQEKKYLKRVKFKITQLLWSQGILTTKIRLTPKFNLSDRVQKPLGSW